jgi:hypothetical protein
MLAALEGEAVAARNGAGRERRRRRERLRLETAASRTVAPRRQGREGWRRRDAEVAIAIFWKALGREKGGWRWDGIGKTVREQRIGV